jgi:hypothetical protein
METSYNGWEASPDPDALGVDKSFAVAGVTFPGGVLGGDVAVVLGYVATQMHEHVEPLHDGWCWGYTYKTASNSPESLSCHSSATALDINSPDHGDGAQNTYSATQQDFIRQLVDDLAGVVTWGGDWDDDMHWEISGSAAEVKQVADRIRGGDLSSPAPPDQQQGQDDDVTDDDVQRIAAKVWAYMVGNGGAGATLEEVRATNRDMNAKLSKLCDPRNHNVDGTG